MMMDMYKLFHCYCKVKDQSSFKQKKLQFDPDARNILAIFIKKVISLCSNENKFNIYFPLLQHDLLLYYAVRHIFPGPYGFPQLYISTFSKNSHHLKIYL